MNVKERKLFESTQYLISIANRIIAKDNPKFILEDVLDALKNIGTKQSREFVRLIETKKKE